ncbi:hypothetical protein [Undibacterium sp.]|uniref:hypothetical protein n=1 Tax=Undibacterium sp. TaxID=1914977 RepID=UPI00374D66B2
MNTVPAPRYPTEESPVGALRIKPFIQAALQNLPRNHEFHADVRQLYEDFKQLGYFDRYGSVCFAMAAMTAKILRAKGYSTEVKACHAIFSNAGEEFYLGYKGYTQPGQVEGHVVCLVNGNIVLDFGLGSAGRHFGKNFYSAIACVATNYGPVLATIELGNGMRAQWRTDWTGPDIEAELQRQEPLLQPLMANYNSYRNNRIGYLLHKLFMGKKSGGLLI